MQKFMLNNGHFVVRSTMGVRINKTSSAGKYLSMDITATNLREAVKEIYEQAGKIDRKLF